MALRASLGFDAQGVPQTLDLVTQAIRNLSSALGELNDKITSFNRRSNTFKTKITELAEALRQLTLATQQLPANIQKAIDVLSKHAAQSGKTKKATDQLILSWQTILRLFQIQVFHQTLRDLINNLKQATLAAAELNLRIAEIQTLSQSNPFNTEKLTTSIRDLSDSFGKDALDIAKAIYESISNQITNAGNSVQFLTTALRFSQATVSTTAEAVDLISSALNSFQISSISAERVAAVFFKTIDLGRSVASELSQSFGRVGSLAATLGISLEETAAAISTLTIQGIKTNEAYTLLNNIFTKLIKPTEAMKELFAEWNVESGQAAIATFGFEGVLRKLSESTGGAAKEYAELFNELRGLRGALVLSGSHLETFRENLTQMRDASKSFEGAVGIIQKSLGQRFQEQLQRVKNFFLIDLGTRALAVFVKVAEAIGGLEVAVGLLVSVFGTLAFILGTAVTITGTYNLTIKLATTLTALFGASISATTIAITGGLIGAGLLLVGVLASVTTRFVALNQTLDASYEKYKKLEQVLVEGVNQALSEQITEFETLLKAQNTFTNQAITNARGAITRQFDLLKEQGSLLANTLALGFNAFSRSLDTGVSKLEDGAQKAEQAAQSAIETIKEIQTTAAGARFDRILQYLNPRDQQAAIISRIKQLTAQGKDNKLVETGDVQQVNKIFNEAIKLRERLTDLQVSGKGGRAAQNIALGAEKDIANLQKQQVQVLDQINQKQQQNAGAQRQAAELEKQRVDKIKDLFQQVKGFDIAAKSNALGPAKAFEEFSKLQDELKKTIGNDKGAQEFLNTLQEYAANVELQKTSIANIAKLEEMRKALDQTTEAFKRQNQQIAETSQTLQTTYIQTLNETQAILDQVASKPGFFQGLFSNPDAAGEEITAREDLQKKLESYKRIADQAQGNLTDKTTQERLKVSLQDVIVAAETLQKQVGKDRAVGITAEGVSVTIAERISQLQDLRVKLEQTQEQATRLQNNADKATLEFNKFFADSNKAIAELNVPVANLGPNVEAATARMQASFQAAAASAESVAKAVAAINRELGNLNQQAAAAAALGQQAANESLGGVLYKAGGGFIPRGTDTIPAMLSPGERVMTAAANRRFGPQLAIMNQTPKYYAQGGTVSNSTTIGDIVVNVNSNIGQQTSREIAQGVRRELRKKTVRI